MRPFSIFRCRRRNGGLELGHVARNRACFDGNRFAGSAAVVVQGCRERGRGANAERTRRLAELRTQGGTELAAEFIQQPAIRCFRPATFNER